MKNLKITDEKGEVHETSIDDNEEIIFISIGSDFNSGETIIYAFESNVELTRLSGYLSEEECLEAISDFCTFEIDNETVNLVDPDEEEWI